MNKLDDYIDSEGFIRVMVTEKSKNYFSEHSAIPSIRGWIMRKPHNNKVRYKNKLYTVIVNGMIHPFIEV